RGPANNRFLFRARADDLHRLAVREEGVVGDQELIRKGELEAGGVVAVSVPELDEHLRLIQGHPVRNAVGEAIYNDSDVFSEPVDALAVEPPAALVEGFGVVPVE